MDIQSLDLFWIGWHEQSEDEACAEGNHEAD